MNSRPLLCGALCLCVLTQCCKRSDKPKKQETAATSSVSPSTSAQETAVGGQQTEIVVLTAVELRTAPELEIELYPRELAKQVGSQLTAAQRSAVATEEVPAGRLARPARLEMTISITTVEHGDGNKALLAAAEAWLRFADGRGLEPRENVIVERPLSQAQAASLPRGMASEHAARAALAAGRGIAEKQALRTAPAEQVTSALGSDDEDQVQWALAIVGERKLAEAYDSVIIALRSKTDAVRQSAVGTLVALGDPRGVKPLTEFAEFSDYDNLRMVIEAVSVLGGEEAMEYLQFVATGHPDDGIKQQAADGLARLRKKARASRVPR